MIPQQFEIGEPVALRVQWYDGDGLPVVPDGTACTVTVTDGAGSALVTAGTAAAAGTATPGLFTHTLAPRAEVAALTAVWSALFSTVARTSLTRAEVVGWHLFTVAQARTWDKGNMASATSYPAQTVEDERARICAALEERVGWPPIPRYGSRTVSGNSTDRLYLGVHRIISVLGVTVDGTAFTAEELADLVVDGSMLIRESGARFTAGQGNVTVHYRRGPEWPVDDADRAGLYLLRDRLVPADLSPRVLTQTDEMGVTRLATPGAHWPFGIPIVDQWCATHDERLRVG